MRSNTSLRGVFFDEVGRAFLRSFFLFSFFFFAVEKSKPEIKVSVSRAAEERNCGKKCGEESCASDRKRLLSEIFLTVKK